LGVQKPKVDFLLVGDSHANHFTGMFDLLARDAGMRGYDVTQSATPFLIGVERFSQQGDMLVHYDDFAQRNAFIASKLVPRQYDYVVLGGKFASFYGNAYLSLADQAPEAPTPELFRESMRETLQMIIAAGSTPVLIKGNPTFKYDVSDCTLNNLRFGLNNGCSMPRDEFDAYFRDWSQFVEQLQEQFNQLVVIDPAKVMCDDEWCYSELDGLPLYKDSGHLNYEGSKLIGRLYIEQFGNPFTSEVKGHSDR